MECMATAAWFAELESAEEQRAAEHEAELQALQKASAAKAAEDSAMIKAREAQAVLDAVLAAKNDAAVKRAREQLLKANKAALEAEKTAKAAQQERVKVEAVMVVSASQVAIAKL